VRARRKCATSLCTCGALDSAARRRSTSALGDEGDLVARLNKSRSVRDWVLSSDILRCTRVFAREAARAVPSGSERAQRLCSARCGISRYQSGAYFGPSCYAGICSTCGAGVYRGCWGNAFSPSRNLSKSLMARFASQKAGASQSPNKQLERAVIPHRTRDASAPFHHALASRLIRRRGLAQLRR